MFTILSIGNFTYFIIMGMLFLKDRKNDIYFFEIRSAKKTITLTSLYKNNQMK